MKIAHRIGAILAAGLGLAHTAVGFFGYHRLTLSAMWFFGAGIAIIFGGFLNVALGWSPGEARLLRLLCILANAILMLLFLIVLQLIQEPQVFVGIALFAFLLIASALRKGEPAGAA